MGETSASLEALEEDWILEQHLGECTKSFVQLTAMISSGPREPQQALLESRNSLIKMILELNLHRKSTSICKGFIGCTMRLFDRMNDLVLVADLVPSDGTSGCPDQCIGYWVRPRTLYELRSSGVKFSKSTIYPIEDQHETHFRPGDSVAALGASGLWVVGIVKCIRSIDNSPQQLTVSCRNGAELVVPQSGDNVVHVKDPHSGCSSDSNSYSESESDSDNTPNKSADFSKTSRLRNLVQTGYCLGEWERFTKGLL
jgi:hypothetical protein